MTYFWSRIETHTTHMSQLAKVGRSLLRRRRLVADTCPAARAFRTIAGAGSLDAIPADLAAAFPRNRARNEALLEKLKERSAYAAQGGGEKAIARHTLKNKKMLVLRLRVRRGFGSFSGLRLKSPNSRSFCITSSFGLLHTPYIRPQH